MLEKGDRVCNKNDETETGTVMEIIFTRLYVKWDTGKTWLYPARDLIKI